MYKGSWSKIAKQIPKRDNRACYERWEVTLLSCQTYVLWFWNLLFGLYSDGTIMSIRIVRTLHIHLLNQIFCVYQLSQLYCFFKVNKNPLEEWEIEKLKENHTRYGNKWSLVVRNLNGRTPLQAKNFFTAEKKSL